MPVRRAVPHHHFQRLVVLIVMCIDWFVPQSPHAQSRRGDHEYCRMSHLPFAQRQFAEH